MQRELCVTDMIAYVSLQMNLDDDLGIAIAGGIDTPAIPNDTSIVITNVAKGSIADGKLRYSKLEDTKDPVLIHLSTNLV